MWLVGAPVDLFFFPILKTCAFSEDGKGSRVKIPQHLDVTAQTLQIGQMIMSLLHSWGLDSSLDITCSNVLGLLRPRTPVSYGLISKSGKDLAVSTAWCGGDARVWKASSSFFWFGMMWVWLVVTRQFELCCRRHYKVV